MASPINKPIAFPAILASSVHDIKNSLAIVRELIMQLAIKQQSSKNEDFIQLEFEANRMNNSLIQLLELYKIDTDLFNLNIDEYSVSEILQEIEAQQAPLLHLNKIQLVVDCSEDLYCYCDYYHVCNALISIINNAQRYTRSKIHLSAYKQDYVVFCLEDDGQGYPEHLQQDYTTPSVPASSIYGSTGLGLHFVSTIAGMHKSNDKKGYVKIDNDSCIGGARFRLFLP